MTPSKPWEPDRPLSAKTVSAAISACFPEVNSASPRFLGSGWEYDAWLTADGWVFRFPRRAEAAGYFELEQRVHDLVARFLPPDVAIPHAELLGQPAAGFPYPIAAHRFIPGVPSDEAEVRHLPSLAREIGRALGAIHSIPVGSARAAGLSEIEVAGRGEWIESGLSVLDAMRGQDPVVDRAVEWVRRSATIEEPPAPLRFIHHDLSPEHLLVDPASGRLTGILDWTDAIIGDAARDFVFLVAWRGWEFTEEVLRAYPHPVDAGFRDRLRFKARILTPIWLGLAHARGTEIEKLTGWVHNAYAPVVSK
jgi:aminoglycoside phosphotransferase (APT) family kinase protein